MRTLLMTLALVLAAPLAHAQTFPPDAEWTPLSCRGALMHDGVRDQSGAVDERDLVGDGSRPAGFRATDDQYLYLRMRVDVDPAPGGTISPFAWGMELDLDDDRRDYELLLMADGVSGGVLVFTNQTTTIANSPRDPADTPAVDTFPMPSHALVSPAPGNAFDGTADFYLSIAVPWTTLEPLGLSRDTPTFVWAATSSTSAALDGDVACHDGATGAPTLDGTASDPTVLDPDVDSDDDGYSDDEEVRAGTDPQDPASHPGGTPVTGNRLAGGGGCSVGTASQLGGGLWLLVLAVVGALGGGRRRRR
jgi:MYXO-CTERM domain-containing protein